MGMDGLPLPDQNITAEICIEIEGLASNPNNQLRWDQFKIAVRAALDDFERNTTPPTPPPPAPKKTRTSGTFKKKRAT